MAKVYIVTSVATTYNAGGETLNAWVERQKISDPVEFARYLRAVTKEGEGVDLSQTDERIVEIAEHLEDEDTMVQALVEDNAAALGQASYSKSDGTAVTGETYIGLRSSAAVIASKLDDVADLIDTLADKDEELKFGPRDILFAMRKALGDQGMMQLPIPGSTEKETEHYDKYKFNAQDTATGKTKTLQGSVIKDIELAMKGGAQIEELKNGYKKANSKSPDAPAHIASMPVDTRMTNLRSLENKQGYRRKALSAAIKLWHMYVDINAVDPKRIVLSFLYERDEQDNLTGNPVKRSRCMSLEDKQGTYPTEWYTISQVMSFKPSWCTPENIKAEGNSWKALQVSASRSKPEAKVQGIKTNEQLLSVLTMAKQRLGDNANTAAFNKSVLDKKNTSMHMIIGDLYLDLKALWEQGLDKLYSKAAAAEAEVEVEATKAAAARLAAQHNSNVKAA